MAPSQQQPNLVVEDIDDFEHEFDSHAPAPAPGLGGSLRGLNQTARVGAGMLSVGWPALFFRNLNSNFPTTTILPAFPCTVSYSGLQGKALPPDQARALRALLWGNHGEPPASWKQVSSAQ